MLNKITKQFAHHGMPLNCDIYAQDDYPAENPVFLYFHGGGLVGWGRTAVPPWLVQVGQSLAIRAIPAFLSLPSIAASRMSR